MSGIPKGSDTDPSGPFAVLWNKLDTIRFKHRNEVVQSPSVGLAFTALEICDRCLSHLG